MARPDTEDAELQPLLVEEMDWGRLALLANRERALVPLWQRLSAMEQGALPEGASQLQTMAMVAEFRMLHLQTLLLDTLDLFAGRDIDVMLLKGPALGITVYPRFVDRPMWDLDVLVPDARAREAWEAMVEKGWKPAPIRASEEFYDEHHHLRPLDDPRNVGCVLEIHRELMPGESPFGFAATDFWSAAEQVDLEGRRIHVPHITHQVVHLSTHFAWSHMMDSAGWRTFRDLAWIARELDVDWDEVVELARATKAATCCYWTLRLARTLVALDVPDSVLRELQPPGSPWRLSRLERAFVFSLLPGTERACPSVALFRRLWSMGIRPEWSGHVGDRPWDIVDAGGDDMGTGPGQRSTVWEQVLRAPHWVRFAAATLRSG